MAVATGFESFVTEQVPLASRTWLGIGGPAELLATPTTLDELVALVKWCSQEGKQVRVLGGGSNLLVRDAGTQGVVLLLSAPCFCGVEVNGTQVKVGGGATLAEAITLSVGAGLAGLDALVGIPGAIGGALHCNSGSQGGDIGQWVQQVTLLARDGEVITRSRGEMVFGYRESSLDELAIIDATFALDEDDPERLTKRMQKQWIVKKGSQPLIDQRTACAFKNPRGMSAGSLIDQAGLKGTAVGAAEVSEKHGNFIVAKQGATSDDVLKLIDQVRSRVAERLGVELETALEIW